LAQASGVLLHRICHLLELHQCLWMFKVVTLDILGLGVSELLNWSLTLLVILSLIHPFLRINLLVVQLLIIGAVHTRSLGELLLLLRNTLGMQVLELGLLQRVC